MALDNIPTLGPGGFNGNLDKVLVYKNGGSEVACSLLTLTNSALNIAGVYVDAVNQRIGIGVPNPAYPFEISAPSGNSVMRINTNSGYSLIDYKNNFGSTYGLGIYGNGITNLMNGVSTFYFDRDGTNTFGNSITSLGARVGIKGSGSTSATTSLLVQNSSGGEMFKITDDRVQTATGNGFYFAHPTYANSLRIESIGNNSQRIAGGPAGENIVFGSGGYNSIAINAGEVYFSSNLYGPQMGLTGGSACFGAQSGPIASAQLQVISTTKGFLKPKMTTVQKNAIASPTAGLEVYDTDLNRPCFFNGTSWITL